MTENESDFLTHQHRAKFIRGIIPLINIFIIPIIAFSATNKLVVIGFCLLNPLIGVGFLALSTRFKDKELAFKILPIAINSINAFLMCWMAGANSPAFLIGIPLIGACTLIYSNIRHLIIAIIYAMTFVIFGSYMAGKTIPELFTYLVLFICYSFILIRMLHFTIIQGREIMLANKINEIQKQLIEEKNKNITDSLNYAKRIQEAKLPNKELIYSALPDSFALFKPKDIVSGDFYYFRKNDKTVFIASADCTGHGVPGAFMSMIGSEKLDTALAYSADTSEILMHLNKGIKVSLHQTDSNESTRDGMDIALCSVDTDTRVVKYAGANRPLWIIRNGQKVVEEIKATKKAIGGFTEDNQHFDTHVVQLQQGDTFYISTDGYADTFGKDGKKLMTKMFKEILLSIQDKSMQDQELYLDKFIEDWKAGTEQVDDILVIGVRV